jgi:cytoskeletal protein CcmA (bactofilin family)
LSFREESFMAMFDIGKRSSGSDQSKKDEGGNFFDTPDTPKEGVAPPRSGIASRSRDAAIVGPSIHIEGTLRGEEDLIIEGRVSGTVKLQGHSLTVGTHGQINADIYAHTIVVEGTVEGNLFGAERVLIRQSANIRGNITAPRVSLEEGARFKGAIEMDSQVVEEAMGTTKSRSAATGQGSAGSSGGASAVPSAASSSTESDKSGAAGKLSSSGGKAGSTAG